MKATKDKYGPVVKDGKWNGKINSEKAAIGAAKRWCKKLGILFEVVP